MLVLAQLARNWWAFVFRGVVGILFGVLALVQPGITLGALILLFAIWMLLDGVLALINSVGAAQAGEPWWPLVFEGLLAIAAGLVTFKWPDITALTFLFIIAFWSIFRGILVIVAAARLRHEIQGEWWFILGGLASVVFGVLVFLYPGSGALAVVWLIGIYAIIFGIALLMFGFRLKGLADKLPAATR